MVVPQTQSAFGALSVVLTVTQYQLAAHILAAVQNIKRKILTKWLISTFTTLANLHQYQQHSVAFVNPIETDRCFDLIHPTTPEAGG